MDFQHAWWLGLIVLNALSSMGVAIGSLPPHVKLLLTLNRRTCADISDTKTIRAYIGPKNELKLQYEVNFPKEGSTYWYQGGKKVGAQTGNNPSPTEFTVPETQASAVA